MDNNDKKKITDARDAWNTGRARSDDQNAGETEAKTEIKRLKDIKKREDFSYWWNNVYWFHYKWHTIGSIVAIILIVSFVYSIATNKDPDFKVVVVTNTMATNDYFSAVNEKVQSGVGDLNGDGQAYTLIDAIYLTDNPQSEYDMVMPQKLVLTYLEEYTQLYFADDYGLNSLMGAEVLAPLDKLGLADGYKGLKAHGEYAIEIQSLPEIAKLGYSDERPLYAVFKDSPQDAGDPEEYFMHSLAALDALMQ